MMNNGVIKNQSVGQVNKATALVIPHNEFQTIGGDRMVGPLGVVISQFRPTSRERGGNRTTTLMQRDVGALPPGLSRI